MAWSSEPEKLAAVDALFDRRAAPLGYVISGAADVADACCVRFRRGGELVSSSADARRGAADLMRMRIGGGMVLEEPHAFNGDR